MPSFPPVKRTQINYDLVISSALTSAFMLSKITESFLISSNSALITSSAAVPAQH